MIERVLSVVRRPTVLLLAVWLAAVAAAWLWWPHVHSEVGPAMEGRVEQVEECP